MSVACVSWLPVTSLPPMSTNQMWLAWLTGLSSSHWQLTLLCVQTAFGKMPPESCLSSFCFCFFNLLFTFCFTRFIAPLCPHVCSCVSVFFLLSSSIIATTSTDHSLVNVSSVWLSESLYRYPAFAVSTVGTLIFFSPCKIKLLSHYLTIVSVDTKADSVSFNSVYG